MPAVTVANPGSVIVTTATTAPGTTPLTEAPPALRSDVVLAQPSPSYVWIPGYWSSRSLQFSWVSGHWELPPNSRTVLVAPRWDQQGNVYKFYDGYWN